MKKVFSEGMKYAKDNAPWFFPPQKLCDLQSDLVQKANDPQTLMWAVNMSNPTVDSAFDSPEPIKPGKELQASVPNFTIAPVSWYFFVGNCGSVSFCIMFFRRSLANVDSTDTPLYTWMLSGGYSYDKQPWVSIPVEWVNMNYISPAPNQPPQSATFTLSSENYSFGSMTPLEYFVNLKFTDINGGKHSFSTLMRARTSPVQQFPGACGGCDNGRGSLYLCLPDLDISLSIDERSPIQGKGWIDIQTAPMPLPSTTGFYNQAFSTVTKTLGVPASDGWFWGFIQDEESGLRWMYVSFFTKKYTDLCKVGNTLDVQYCNKIKEGMSHPMYPTDFKLKILTVVNLDGTDYPTSYLATLPGGKKVMLRVDTTPGLCLTPTMCDAYEMPATLLEEQGRRVLGTAFIEVNIALDREKWIDRILTWSGGDPKNSHSRTLIKNAMDCKQPFIQVTAAFIMVLIPILAIIGALYYVYKGKDDRGRRTKIALLFVLIILIFYSV